MREIECWGAQGGGRDKSALPDLGYGGKGGYSIGTIFLYKVTKIYVFVGGTGKVIADGYAEGGYNGGGSSWGTNEKTDPAGGGGGATDIRLNFDDLYSRVIVAGGGGGGGEDNGIGGFGGGLEGWKNSINYKSYPGTQTSSSHGAKFGKGAHTSYNGGGGGGGWYGGGVNNGRDTPYDTGDTVLDTQGGSGGSGYVYTSDTFRYYPPGGRLNYSYFLEDAKTIGGNESIIEPNGTSSIGHFGDGYARITTLAFKYQNIFYSIHTESELSVLLKDQECNSSIDIPSYIDNKAVTSILPGAFHGNICLREVRIPKTIEWIGDDAFSDAVNLKDVIFERSSRCKSLGVSAFSSTAIETISIPSSVISVGEKCFMNTLIKTAFFDINSMCKNISEKSFFNTSLTSISLPTSVAFIGNYAFANCTSLKFVSYCSSAYQENRNIFDKSDLLLNVSVANYYLHSSFCGLPALNYGNCKFGTVPKCPLCLYKTQQSVYVYLCILFE